VLYAENSPSKLNPKQLADVHPKSFNMFARPFFRRFSSFVSSTSQRLDASVRTRQRQVSCLQFGFWRDRMQFQTLVQPCVNDDLRLAEMMLWFRERGHMVATLDPLKRVERGVWKGEHISALDFRNYRDVEALLEWVRTPLV
jgi:2-oxoglutarate dehydrogenase complex dehydrogenase (E1) component-like enzyme